MSFFPVCHSSFSLFSVHYHLLFSAISPIPYVCFQGLQCFVIFSAYSLYPSLNLLFSTTTTIAGSLNVWEHHAAASASLLATKLNPASKIFHIQYNTRFHICHCSAPWHFHLQTFAFMCDMTVNQDYQFVCLMLFLLYTAIGFAIFLLSFSFCLLTLCESTFMMYCIVCCPRHCGFFYNLSILPSKFLLSKLYLSLIL